jgi:7,8-dihydroneopterin aldolase/epimerase/oxygenase
MDIVFIRGLEVRAIIGVREWERQVRQMLVVNLEMQTDVAAAAATDELDNTLSYSDVANAVEKLVSDSSFGLIETLAERVAELVLAEFPVGWLRLEVIKPRPLSGRHVVGVVIERTAPGQ